MAADWQVGQKVIAVSGDVRRGSDGAEEHIVRKVGRQYVYASRDLPGWEHPAHWRKFDAETGYEQVKFGAGGHLYTPEGWEESKAHDALVDELRSLGLIRNSFGSTPFSNATTDQLRRITEILKEA